MANTTRQTYPATFGLLPTDRNTLRSAADARKSQTVSDAPGGEQVDNTLRATNAAHALLAYHDRAYGSNTNEPLDQTVSDLIGDLYHLCDALGIDMFDQLDSGERHYLAELHGDH